MKKVVTNKCVVNRADVGCNNGDETKRNGSRNIDLDMAFKSMITNNQMH